MINGSSELPNRDGASHETSKDQTSTEAIFSRLNEEKGKLEDLFPAEPETMKIEEIETQRDAVESTPEYKTQLKRVSDAEKAAQQRFNEKPEASVGHINDPEEFKRYLEGYDRHLMSEGLSRPERQQRSLPVVESFSNDKHFKEMLAQEGLIAYTPSLGRRIMQRALQRISGGSNSPTSKDPITTTKS